MAGSSRRSGKSGKPGKNGARVGQNVKRSAVREAARAERRAAGEHVAEPVVRKVRGTDFARPASTDVGVQTDSYNTSDAQSQASVYTRHACVGDMPTGEPYIWQTMFDLPPF